MMKQGPVGEVDSIARAVEAAEQVFDPKPGVSPYEPSDTREARAAVQRLGELFAALPSKIAEALDGARNSGTLVSSDRLQGLAEIVQNADDAGARRCDSSSTPTDLLVTQNGNPVRLPDVLGFATPWLSTKTDDGDSHRPVWFRALGASIVVKDARCALRPLSLPDRRFRRLGLLSHRLPTPVPRARLDHAAGSP